jgi:hypothetical protein
LERIVRYYLEVADSGTAEAFLEDVKSTVGLIESWPHLPPKGLASGTREKLLHSFPYRMIYEVVNDSTVLFLDIKHFKQHHQE